MLKLLPFLLLPVVLQAQPRITPSPTFETNGNASTVGLLKSGQGDNLLLVYRSFKKDRIGFKGYLFSWAADAFSPDLKRLSNNEPDKIEFPDGEDAETGFAIDFGGPGLLLQQHLKKEKKMVVYHCAINPEGVIGKPKRVADYASWKQEDGAQESHLLNADSSLLLLALKPPRKEKDEPISYTILNREWKNVREGKLKMPGIDAEILSGDLLLATDTSIWMAAWVREKGQENSVRQEIWVWRNPTKPPQRIDMALSGERVITDMILTQSKQDGTVYVGGTFAAASKGALKGLFKPAIPPLDHHPEQGSFFVKIDKAGTVMTKQPAMFRESTFRFWGLNPSDVKKGDGVNVIKPRKIWLQPDGSAWLTLEEYYEDPGSAPGMVPGTTGALARSGGPRGGPAIAVRFDPEGKSQQELLIPKRAWSIHGSGMGYLLLAHKGQLAFLYNDHEDNLKRTAKEAGNLKPCKIADDDGMAMGQQDACTVLYFVDHKGQGKAQKVFGFKEAGYWFDPYSVFQLSPTRYIIGCDGRSGQFGLLRVDWPE